MDVIMPFGGGIDEGGGRRVAIQVMHRLLPRHLQELDWTAMDAIFLFRKGLRYSEVLKYNYNCSLSSTPLAVGVHG